MLILIPAYKPDRTLISLCEDLLASPVEELEILVVDDGSGASYTDIFTTLSRLDARIHLLTQAKNTGKGAALRAGFRWAQQNRPTRCLVTADADGQHLPHDILAVGKETQNYAEANQPALVLGVRTLETGGAASSQNVPLRSRMGNAATVSFFTLATGQKIADTQTGLRGLTPDLLGWAVSLPGNRYDYEFTMLLRASRANMRICQVAVSRVYEVGNPTSHFQPVRDSLRIYTPLLLFFAASLAGFITDTLALAGLVALGLNVGFAVLLARIFSALVNYWLNRWVMADGGVRSPHGRALVRYGVLAVGLLATNAVLMEALTGWGVPLLVAKVLVELSLVPVSFAAQRRWVFSRQYRQDGAVRRQSQQIQEKEPLAV